MKLFIPKLVTPIAIALLVPIVSSAQQPAPVPNPSVTARARAAEILSKDAGSIEKLLPEISGSLKQLPPGGNVFFEQIQDCGFYPQETRLECVLRINQQGGYGGPIGSFGSFEFVAFFVDFGAGFQYVGSGILHMTDGSPNTRFAVYRDFNPPGGLRTSNGGGSTTTTTSGPILKARAILQWGWPTSSTNPSAIPVWGNVVDFAIRMMPIR